MKRNTLLICSLTISLICCTSFLVAQDRTFHMPELVGENDYQAGKVIFKIDPSIRKSATENRISDSELDAIFLKIPSVIIGRKFPNHLQPESQRNAQGLEMADLSLIYEATFDPLFPVEKACNLMLNSSNIQYAEPLYIPQLLYNPNDPDTASQYYLGLIQAYSAWDITKGDTSIVIGVTDTGTDLDHPDLVNGIKYNYADPINGIDDDNDGFTDNFMGWDVGQNDNDPSVDIVHGSFVSGFAGASTDNGIGMAGPGFNTKFLPVKISSNGVLTGAYDGIVYSADHGCQIINCSWGGFGGGQFGQDVVDYATINKNRLVIGACGNSNNENPFYPSSYNYVLSVTGTNDMDEKWVNSSYGAFIDISAPGEAVYSTIFDDAYSSSSGTSFAAPIVAAGAALVMAHLPALTPLQVAEQLRATADESIYSLPGNAGYEFKLGKGRLNLERALTETPKSVRMSGLTIVDNNDNAFSENDTLSITGLFTNYLAPLNNLTINLTSNNPGITIINGSLSPGAMATFDTFDNASNPLSVAIGPGIPFNTKITFTLTFTDGIYTDWQIFDLVVNVDYINLLVNDIGVSITSRGRIGYNEGSQNQGIGFTYNDGSSLLFDGSLMIGSDTTHVSDRAFGDPASAIDDDFVSVVNVRKVIPTVLSDMDLDSDYNDSGAGATSQFINVNQRSYAWSTPADSKYVIVEYVIHNDGFNQLQGLYAGIYCDWDLGNAVDNRAEYDPTRKMGYVYSLGSSNNYVAVKQLSPGANNCYALENDGSSGSVGIYNGFTETEKYTTLSTARTSAGQGANGGDVSVTVASGPHTFNSLDSITVAFAIIAGEDLNSINASADAANIKYSLFSNIPQVPGSFQSNLGLIYPNPGNGEIIVDYSVGNNEVVNISMYDISGRLVKNLITDSQGPGNYSLKMNSLQFDNGIYFLRMDQNGFTQSRKFSIVN